MREITERLYPKTTSGFLDDILSDIQPENPRSNILTASAAPSIAPTNVGVMPSDVVSSNGIARAMTSLEQSLKNDTQPRRDAVEIFGS
jgi:hypothetical protein